jgi:hypothetical protein
VIKDFFSFLFFSFLFFSFLYFLGVLARKEISAVHFTEPRVAAHDFDHPWGGGASIE